MGQREKVVIVEVRGQWLVLGVTAQHSHRPGANGRAGTRA
ncbi:MAG: flagellar biosynthetic protein FliO [Pseudomonas veronii]|nr:flagellar biosynthetic protein FliO [Pseudomonas veronii]